MASTGTREFEMLQSLRLGNAATDDLAMLSDNFAKGGAIIELNMARLMEVMLREEGQSKEDYHHRAIFFNHIAEFFRQGRAYCAEKDESANFVRTMQMLVDSILVEDGRSAGDYNARAQFFSKSAGVFPFNADVQSI